MAQVRNNIIIKGLSGSIGNQLVFKQDKAGRTIVGAPPSIDPDRTYSEAELERQEVFRDATVYAKGAKGEAVLEQGVAVPAEGAWLTYTTTATAQNGAQLVVTAEDLPGNVTDMTVVFSD